MKAKINKDDPRTIPQAVRHIYSKGGVSGFYIGYKISLFRTIPAGGMCFVAYEFITEQFKKFE
jgi:hypothetical protein